MVRVLKASYLKTRRRATFKHKTPSSNLQHPHSKHLQFLPMTHPWVRWLFLKHNRNTVYVVGNQGPVRFAYSSPVIWTLECSPGQVGNPTPGYRVSVMPGLHWTHVWNRRSGDPVTYRRLKLSSGARLTQRGEGNNTKRHWIHLTQIWCLVIFHFEILKGKFHELWLRGRFLPYGLRSCMCDEENFITWGNRSCRTVT